MVNYAKLENGYPHYAPSSIRLDGMTVANPAPEQLKAAGYLPVVMAQAPQTDDRHYPESGWEQTETEIRQVWIIRELPSAEPTEAERLAAVESAVLTLMGGKANV